MRLSVDGRGYLVPSEQPAGVLCVRVYVPDDPLYVYAFWGHLERLTQWNVWERGGTKGKDAASVWKDAWKLSRDDWECSLGDCGLMDVRQKPNEPCTLQKQNSCTGDWVDFASITLCTQAIPEPHSENPQSELNDALWAIKETVNTAHYLLISNTPSYVRYMMTRSGIPNPGAMIDDMATDTQEDRQDYIDDADWGKLKDTIACATGECNLLDPDLLNLARGEWLRCLIETIIENSFEAGNRVGQWINLLLAGASAWEVAGVMSMYPGIGEQFDFDDTVCSWGITYDFTADDGGWIAQVDDRWDMGVQCGQWGTSGWGVIIHPYSSPANYRILSIRKEAVSNFNITRVKTYWTFQVDEGNSGSKNAATSAWVDSAWSVLTNKTDYGDGSFSLEWTGSADTDKLWIESEGWPINWPDGYCTKIELEGTGDAPTWV